MEIVNQSMLSFVVWRDDSSGGQYPPIIGEIRQLSFRL